MAVIQSGADASVLTINPTSKGARAEIYGPDGNVLSTVKGSQAAYGLAVQELKDAGRTYLAINLDHVAGIAAEALATALSVNLGGAVTASQSSYTVSAGKTLRLVSLVVSVIASTTTAVSTRVRVRHATSGAVAVSSGLVIGAEVGSVAAVANTGNTETVPIPDGIEIPGGQQIGISHLESTATGFVSAHLIGFEY